MRLLLPLRNVYRPVRWIPLRNGQFRERCMVLLRAPQGSLECSCSVPLELTYTGAVDGVCSDNLKLSTCQNRLQTFSKHISCVSLVSCLEQDCLIEFLQWPREVGVLIALTKPILKKQTGSETLYTELLSQLLPHITPWVATQDCSVQLCLSQVGWCPFQKQISPFTA